jgi:hypothetical protein
MSNPARSNPKSKPPIPEKKEAAVGLSNNFIEVVFIFYRGDKLLA